MKISERGQIMIPKTLRSQYGFNKKRGDSIERKAAPENE